MAQTRKPAFDLDGKVAIVTGSTRGIGRATARLYAQAGARVVVSGRTPEHCEATAAELQDEGLDVTAIACHVGRDEQQAALVERTLALFLASDASCFVSGQLLVADGGRTVM